MSKIDDEGLLSMQAQQLFDGSELRLLATLLDNEICDWTAERRAKYEALGDDLSYLAERLLSNGHDYGWRKTRRWAKEPPAVPPDTSIHIICFCGTRITVKIRERNEPLFSWDVTCPKHDGPHTRHLGAIRVKGTPGLPNNAQLITQQILIHHEEDLRNFPTHTFWADAKF